MHQWPLGTKAQELLGQSFAPREESVLPAQAAPHGPFIQDNQRAPEELIGGLPEPGQRAASWRR